MVTTVTAQFIFSGMPDYWSGDGNRRDDDKGCVFASYGRTTTLRELVDELVQDYISGGDTDDKSAFENVSADDVRAAILESFTDLGRRDYDTGAVCEMAEAFADANPSTDDDDDMGEYPQVIFLLTAESDDDDSEPSEPDEDDITTKDHEHFYQSDRLILERAGRLRGDEPAEWYSWDTRACHLLGKFGDNHVAALKAYMARTNYYPNCWFISDHGNAHLMDLEA